MRCQSERIEILDFWNNLGSVIWYSLTLIIFISYLSALFAIVGDLLRDRELGGGMKAVWLFFLFFFPFITALIYVLDRGNGMAVRAQSRAEQARAATDDYIRSVTGSPSDEIARAKALLDAGTITAEEYAALKAKALA